VCVEGDVMIVNSKFDWGLFDFVSEFVCLSSCGLRYVVVLVACWLCSCSIENG